MEDKSNNDSVKFSVPSIDLQSVPSVQERNQNPSTPKTRSRLSKLGELKSNNPKSSSMTNIPHYLPRVEASRKKSDNFIVSPNSKTTSKRRTLQLQDIETIKNLKYSTDSESSKVKKTKSFQYENESVYVDGLIHTKKRRRKKEKKNLGSSLGSSLDVEDEQTIVKTRKHSNISGLSKQLNSILHNPKKLDGYRIFLEGSNAIELLNFWLEVENYSILINCTDSVMANDHAIKIFKSFCDSKLDSSIRSKITEQMNQSLIENSLESNFSFLLERQNEAFDLLLNTHFLSYWELLTPISGRKRSGAKNVPVDSVDDDEADLDEVVLEFDSPNTEDNIRFNTVGGKELLVSATIGKLIAYLTSTHIDTSFNRIFFLTYRYFINSDLELLELLIKRFKTLTINYANLTSDQQQLKLEIAKNICNLLKYWISFSVDTFKKDADLLSFLNTFIDTDIHSFLPSNAAELKEHIEHSMQHQNSAPSIALSTLKSSNNSNVPKPKKLYKGGDLNNLQFEFIPTIELARQMTLLDQSLFRSITPTEVLHQNWTKQSTKHLNSPNVLSMIKQFNRVGHWVISEIISAKEIKRRLEVLTRMIQLTHECYKLKNYNSAMAMISGLKNSNVTRLKKTWNLLSSSSWDMWEEMSSILKIDNNFSELRSEIKNSPAPVLPYLGMFLSDITFNDAENNFLDEEQKVVNFSKMRFLVDYIERMEEYMAHTYYLEMVPEIRHYLITLPLIHETKFYEESLTCEAKASATAAVEGLSKERSASFSEIELDRTGFKRMVRSISKRKSTMIRAKVETIFDKPE